MGAEIVPSKRKMTIEEFMNAPAPQPKKRKMTIAEFANAPAPNKGNAGQAVHEMERETRSLSDATADFFNLDKDLQRATVLPMARDPKTGDYELALPQLAVDAMEGFMLPSHAYKGGDYSVEDTTKFVGPAAPINKAVVGVKSLAKPAKFTKKELKDAPSSRSLFDESKDAFDRAKSNKAAISEDSFMGFLAGAERSVAGDLEERLTPKAIGVMNHLSKKIGHQHSIDDLHKNRQVIQGAMQNADSNDKYVLGKILSAYDDYVDGIDVKDLAKGSVGSSVKDLRSGMDLWKRGRKTELIEGAIDTAKNAASGFENGLRSEFRSILKSRKKRRNFNKEEIKVMQMVVQGETESNILKKIGKFGVGIGQQSNSLLSLIGGIFGTQLGGIEGGLATAAIGTLAQKGAEAATHNAAKTVRAMASGMNPKSKTVTLDTAAKGRIIGSQAVQLEPWQRAHQLFAEKDEKRPATPQDMKVARNAFLRNQGN